MTNLRLPGQYDERLLGSLGLQGPYYNWNRWYLPGVGRYLELDPLALRGMQVPPDWYAYGRASPLTNFDPTGEQTQSDILTCIRHPQACGQANDCRVKAFRATESRFAHQGHNDASDAFRHCYWSCCMAQKMGADLAKKFGDAHENFGGNPSCEKDMDQANNDTGRQLGAGSPTGDCAQACGGAPLQPAPKPPCTPCSKKYGYY